MVAKLMFYRTILLGVGMTDGTNEEEFPLSKEALQPLIKFVALANAGGVAASITVIGATAKNGYLENLLAIPLGLFAFGVIFTILYPTSLFLRIAKQENFEPAPITWIIQDRTLRVSGYGAILAFVAGCFAGVLLVLFS